MVLIASISSHLFAQEVSDITSSDPFGIPANSIKRKFIILLDKGNSMQVELTSLDELDQLKNLDSIVQTFVQDIVPLKDSLSDELLSKKIEYIIDVNSAKRIRIQKFQPAGSSFLVNNGEASLLKLAQDTIVLTGKIQGNVNGVFFRKLSGFHYYRVSFLLNNLNDLSAYMDGMLNEKIKILNDNNLNRNWTKSSDGTTSLKNNPSIRASTPNGYTGGGDYLSLRTSIDVQNYKSYFVPSISIGAAIVTNNNLVRREYGISAESHFLFGKNTNGKLEAFRNNFLTISYGRGSLKDTEVKANGNLYPFISVGYLIRKRGDYYDKNTFKVGLGRWTFNSGTTRIEPTIYFNNFFKGLTPSLRLTQSF